MRTPQEILLVELARAVLELIESENNYDSKTDTWKIVKTRELRQAIDNFMIIV
jgi:hypothetical protein